MTRLIPPLLTALAIWALSLAEGHAQDRAPLGVDDPACAIAAQAAPSGEDAPAPGCPELSAGAVA
jgi:hypothetical protein